MKRKIFILPLLLIAAAFSGMRVSNPAVMTFDEVKYNFGFIHQGDVVSHDFNFTNTGDEPLLITDATVACKCTTVDFPKQPIAKGQKGTIKVTYDSKSAMDRQERTVAVTSNASNSPATLTFKCVVLKAKN
ncbi:MAG: DUF1573 domain-containing protein [Bacteroidetes bacterium]|nr:DUF1573 domain-containing protein [Bacteroidota bacterium]